MKRILPSLLFIAPSLGMAAITNIQDYGKVVCGFYQTGNLLQKFEATLMTIFVDNIPAKFQQVRFEVRGVQVQYQVLIEQTETTKIDGNIQLLQNLKIDTKETTLDVPGKDLGQIETKNGDYQVKCLVKKID
ncbi:MAG: hypothetical protein ACM3MG_14310 [Bacillota bacterium]